MQLRLMIWFSCYSRKPLSQCLGQAGLQASIVAARAAEFGLRAYLNAGFSRLFTYGFPAISGSCIIAAARRVIDHHQAIFITAAPMIAAGPSAHARVICARHEARRLLSSTPEEFS